MCLGVGLSGSGFLQLGLPGWFAALKAPPMLPSLAVFPPVWTMIYALAGLAAWLVWRAPDVGLRDHRALRAWGWQMALLAVWTPVFFGLHWLLAAAAVGAALLLATGLTGWWFIRLNRRAALLMLPYFAWAGFELYLNAGFWWLNR